MKPIFSALLLVAFTSISAPAAPEGSALSDLAATLINSMDKEQKANALFPLEAQERENWHYVPMERKGIRIDSLNKTQTKLLSSLLSASLSEQGHQTSQEIIQLETLLYQRSDKSDFRDPGKYTTAIFGNPKKEQPWAWRFEGHHLSLNFTIISEKVTLTTPFFFGTNPAEVRKGELKGLRPLGKIEDHARTLAKSLHLDGVHVHFTNKAPKEILTGQDRSAKTLAKEGVSFSELKKEPQTQLLNLVNLIASNQRSENLSLQPADLQNAQFAWAGAFEKDKAHYFRIQTDKFLIEYVNTQNNANHAHLVWRDFENDFGRDLLKEHLEKGH